MPVLAVLHGQPAGVTNGSLLLQGGKGPEGGTDETTWTVVILSDVADTMSITNAVLLLARGEKMRSYLRSY